MKPIGQKDLDKLSEIRENNKEMIKKEKKIKAEIERIMKEEE